MKCQKKADDEEGGEALPLEMANLIGVFYVLFVGIVLSSLYAIINFIVNVYRSTVQNKVCLADSQDLLSHSLVLILSPFDIMLLNHHFPT